MTDALDTVAAVLEVASRELYSVAIDVVARLASNVAGPRRPPLLRLVGGLFTCQAEVEETCGAVLKPAAGVEPADHEAWARARLERVAELAEAASLAAAAIDAVEDAALVREVRRTLGQLLEVLGQGGEDESGGPT